MELKVWVEGIQRIVCGVTEATTCQDIVYALAHATGKTGRFTLIERWRNNERLLAPQEHPLKVVNKWGEYSSEVQLILQRSGGWQGGLSPPRSPTAETNLQDRSKDVRKSLTNNKRTLQVHSSHTSSQQMVREDGQSPNSRTHLKPAIAMRGPDGSKEETVVYNSQYRDLVRLINYQREKLSAQQAELTKYDAEIVFWESKTREQQYQIDYMTQEAAKFEATVNSNEMKLKALSGIEDERNLVQQQERTLKSELTLLRSKLANCETELLLCKNKIRLLSEELEAEEREKEEMVLLVEVEKLQREIEQAKHSSEVATQSADSLRNQVTSLETAIIEKKKQVEKLVKEMKEANLESLVTAPPEGQLREVSWQEAAASPTPASNSSENKHTCVSPSNKSEEASIVLAGPQVTCSGPHKQAGSRRRMIGSPRQLENSVPTSKNPQGVWV